MKTIFDSRNEYFKKPFGAVKEGTSIHFRITLPRYLKCSGAYLVVREDSLSDTVYHPMYWCGMDGYDDETWECDYTPEYSGLIWYYFSINTEEGMKSLFNMDNTGVAKFFNGTPWQLTVYSKDFKTPDWLKGGVMYQIFPDRFYRAEKKKPNIFSDRKLRDDWGGEPEWKPNELGEVKNNDYFGGDLKGITEKLGYLKGLGVTCIYLNPIFEAHSNHRYDTANYLNIDPYLGDEKDYKKLCKEAKKLGMNVILDGVFSHTGSDSVYFNKEKRYDSIGAYNSEESKYKDWYHFISWPNIYNSWWGFETLPELEKKNINYDEFINGKNGVVRNWIKKGCKGWRLDVADELPDCFLDNLRDAVKEEDPESIIIGEVWEDASNKESYGARRRYLLGRQLDSVMNYPFRNAIFSFLKNEYSSTDFCNAIFAIVENYPPEVLHVLMNNIGTHDTERAITILAGEPANGRDKYWQSQKKMNVEEWQKGILLMKMASAMQFTLPGVPCVYYGDEAGCEGYKDPLNRYCYPWGKENHELIDWYSMLGRIRRDNKDFVKGNIHFVEARDRLLSYKRGDNIICIFNRGNNYEEIFLPDDFKSFEILLGSNNISYDENILLSPLSCAIIRRNQDDKSI